VIYGRGLFNTFDNLKTILRQESFNLPSFGRLDRYISTM